MAKSIFFQHPFDLEKDERMQRLDKALPDSGHGLFWKIYHRIRLGGGKYPISGLYAELAGNNQQRKKRLFRVLNQFDLFCISQGMVELGMNLTISEIRPREKRSQGAREKLQAVQRNIHDAYANTLIPDELAQMDQLALENVQTEIREQNEKELDEYH